jgi:hypothetical protein
LFSSSIAISVAFLTATSLIAMVPLSEFNTPTLMPVALAAATVGFAAGAAVGPAAGVGALQAAIRPAAEAATTTPVDTRRNWRLLRFRFNIGQP